MKIKKLGVLYKATDPQGHCYIGQHVGDGSDIGKTYHGSGRYIKATRKKYGNKYFTYWVFAKNLTQEERDEGEKYYIKFFQSSIKDNGYNIGAGGEGGDTFSNLSDEDKEKFKKKISDIGKIIQNRPETKKKCLETRTNRSKAEKAERSKKQSESLKLSLSTPEARKKKSEVGKISSNVPETKKKTADSHRGLKRSDKTKKLMAESKMGNTNALGHKHTQESLDKMSESHKGDTYPTHIRWHKNRGIINPNCEFCVEVFI